MKEGLIVQLDEESQPSEEFLVPVRSKRIAQADVSLHQESRQVLSAADVEGQPLTTILNALRSRPDEASLLRVLKSIQTSAAVNVCVPSPDSAQLVNVLLEAIVPDWWPQLATTRDKFLLQIRDLLITTLRTLVGIGALLNRVKYLTAASDKRTRTESNPDPDLHLRLLILLCSQVLEGDEVLHLLVVGLKQHVQSEAKRLVAWKEILSLLPSGKALSIVAAAEDALKKSVSTTSSSWIADGSLFAEWLGKNICYMLHSTQGQTKEEKVTITAVTAQVLSKALAFTHRDRVVTTIAFGYEHSLEQLLRHSIVTSGEYLQLHERRKILLACLQKVQNECFSTLANHRADATDSTTAAEETKIVGATAKFLCKFAAHTSNPGALYFPLLLDVAMSPISDSSEMCRSLILALNELDKDGSREYLSMIFEKNLERFGDPLFIKHQPMLVQEATTRIILLSASYLHRSQPMLLFTLVRSSTHMQGVSNRLSSSSKRAMWLGMIVAMALSTKVDKPDLQIKFDTPEIVTSEALWYRNLINTADTLGDIEGLQSRMQAKASVSTLRKTSSAGLKSHTTNTPNRNTQKTDTALKPSTTGNSSILRIVEVESSPEDDDFVPYGKPDSDPEDDDEDPTLVKRDKPKPPVYIRDLITGLNEKQDYDRHQVSLTTAADLISRKASFGKEVSDNAEELANILMGLQDTFEMEKFDEMRQRALIATLLAAPKIVAPYIAQHFFLGEYSMQQRTVMLVSLGLGARQIAGFDQPSELQAKSSFPSRQLPPHLHKIYGLPSDRQTSLIEHAATRLETSILQPMALDAADQLTGPNALKVRTFSSRMAVEKARKKPVTNALAQNVAEAFFFPLTGRWWQQARGSQSPWTSTHLLPMFLRTLALIIHASGPSATALPQMTNEFWELLFSVRNAALTENVEPVMESILFAFMVLIDVNEDKRRLASEQTNEILETREWARLVLERVGGADTLSFDLASKRSKQDDANERIRMLAAGVIMKCNEVVEKWQRLMLGGMIEP